MKSSTLPK
ncbi:hypothetical protein CGLO_00090 [Colletotrichum gloeosporioides Cg-14]|uniref:Uncharacterized protein n=1 Tax=Colletotrichum gloeosporioides (strain Cg-14) TaxID=1237896 RepID=T0KVG3_COLGC|nr:hypothetical protein CGLO_00090 [Colletotrichum gloeosporioides Cg-14]